MLSPSMVDRLNQQINLEFFSSNLYLQMSAWCDYKGFEGCARFLRLHAAEEMEHMNKLFGYVNETGALALLGSIEEPPAEFESLRAVFESTYEHEKHVTAKINELVDAALKEPDHATFNFLQWYVAEQHEEETLFRGVLDRFDLLESDGRGLYMLDREIGEMASQVQQQASDGN